MNASREKKASAVTASYSLHCGGAYRERTQQLLFPIRLRAFSQAVERPALKQGGRGGDTDIECDRW
jgi:hypothetical protein